MSREVPGGDAVVWEGAMGTQSKEKASKLHSRYLVVSRLTVTVFSDAARKKTEKAYRHMDLVELATETVGQNKVVLRYRKNGYQQLQSEIDACADAGTGKMLVLVLGGDNVWPAVKAVRSALRDLYLGAPEHSYLYTMRFDKNPEAEPEAYSLGQAEGFVRALCARCEHAGRQCPSPRLLELFVESRIASGSTCCDLSLCPGLDASSHLGMDLEGVLSVLAHDSYWTELRVDGAFCESAARALGAALRTNSTLGAARIENVHGEQDVGVLAHSLGLGVCSLRVLSLGGCRISSASFLKLCAAFETLKTPLLSLSLAGCKLSAKSSEALFNALAKNEAFQRLRQLDYGKNKLEQLGSAALCAWLSAAPEEADLKSLSVAECAADLATVVVAISNGHLCPGIEALDLSGNQMTPLSIAPMQDLCKRARALRVLKLSDTQYPPESIEQLLLCINGNSAICDLSLSLTKNTLGVPGSLSFARGALSFNGVTHLDLSSTKLTARGLVNMLAGFASDMRCLESLRIGHNASEGRDAEEFVAKLVAFIGQTPCLKALGFSGTDRRGNGGAIGSAILPLLKCVGANRSLTWLDVSGHNFNDIGAATLATGLAENSTLTSLSLDRNKITTSGWLALGLGLEKNRTLQHIEYPGDDIAWYHSQLPSSKTALHDKLRAAADALFAAAKRNHDGLQAAKYRPFGEMFPDIDLGACTPVARKPPAPVPRDRPAPSTADDSASNDEAPPALPPRYSDCSSSASEEDDGHPGLPPRSRTMTLSATAARTDPSCRRTLAPSASDDAMLPAASKKRVSLQMAPAVPSKPAPPPPPMPPRLPPRN
eukprot:m51a1_g14309 hypothetical protein (827) ;mRNA; r:486260-489325